MIRLLLDKKRFYASVIMSAILMLHVALMSISPTRLFESASGCGVDSYIRVMDVASGEGSAPRIEGRVRASVSDTSSDSAANEDPLEHLFAVHHPSAASLVRMPHGDLLPDSIPSNLSSRK